MAFVETVFIEGNAGAVLDGAPGSAAPANAVQIGGSDGANLRTIATDGTGQVKVLLENSVPAGTNLMGQVEVSDGTNILGTSAHPVRTDPTGVTTQPVSGAVTSNQGTANTAANAWPAKVTDGTNTAAVKAASTAAAAVDSALVVAVSPNNSVAVTQATAASLNATAVLAAGTATIGSVKITDGTTVPGVIAGTTALKTDLSSVAGTATVTAAAGVQKVGVVGGAGTSLETTAGVIDNNVKNIGNAAVATAASGVQKVGVVDASGNALNSDGAGNLRVNPYGSSGSFKVYKIASTAGNVVAQIAVPAGKKWIVQSANVTLTTNATAGTRQLQMYSSNATPDYIASVWSGFTQAASLAGFYTFAPSVPTNTGSIANNQNVTVGFPQLFLEAGFILYFSVSNGLAGDAFVVRGINVIEVND